MVMKLVLRLCGGEVKPPELGPGQATHMGNDRSGKCILSSSSPGSPSEDSDKADMPAPKLERAKNAKTPSPLFDEKGVAEKSPTPERAGHDRKARSPNNSRVPCRYCGKHICADEYSRWQHETAGSCKRRQESQLQWREWKNERKNSRQKYEDFEDKREDHGGAGGRDEYGYGYGEGRGRSQSWHLAERRPRSSRGRSARAKSVVSRSRSRNKAKRWPTEGRAHDHRGEGRDRASASHVHGKKATAMEPVPPPQPPPVATQLLGQGQSQSSHDDQGVGAARGLPMLFRGLASLLEESGAGAK